MAAGKTVAKSAKRTPRGESSRQRPGKTLMEGILPTQRPFVQPTPVVTLTFCSIDQVAIYIKNGRMVVNAAYSERRKLCDDTCHADRIDRRRAETRGMNRVRSIFDCLPCRTSYNRTTQVTSWESLKGFNILTFAFALLYALVHAGAKSGTSAGFSTGGG